MKVRTIGCAASYPDPALAELHPQQMSGFINVIDPSGAGRRLYGISGIGDKFESGQEVFVDTKDMGPGGQLRLRSAPNYGANTIFGMTRGTPLWVSSGPTGDNFFYVATQAGQHGYASGNYMTARGIDDPPSVPATTAIELDASPPPPPPLPPDVLASGPGPAAASGGEEEGSLPWLVGGAALLVLGGAYLYSKKKRKK